MNAGVLEPFNLLSWILFLHLLSGFLFFPLS
jgi:hypothetical protein